MKDIFRDKKLRTKRNQLTEEIIIFSHASQNSK